MISRLILKMHRKTSDIFKLSAKNLGAHWDDLFDGWSFPIESAHPLQQLIKSLNIKCDLKEFKLQEEHVNQSKKERAMYGKYATILKKIHCEEIQLLSEIEFYERANRRPTGKIDERGRQCFDFPWAWSMYRDPPTPGKSDIAYRIEMNFHKRLKEIYKLREEIQEIHEDLKEMEEFTSQKKVSHANLKKHD